MRPRRILLCTTAYHTAITGAAGVGRMFGAWTRYNPDYEIDVLSEDCGEPGEHLFACKLNFLSRLPVISYYFKSRGYRKCLQKLLTMKRFDVILYNDIWLAHATRRLVRKDLSQTVVAAFMHDDNTVDMPGAFRWNGSAVSHLFRWILERRTIRRLDVVLTNSEYLRQKVNEQYGSVPPARRLYYTARDYARITSQKRERRPGEPIHVLFIKNDFIRGGLEDLLRSLDMLNQYTFELTIAGPTEERIRKKIPRNLLELPNVHLRMPGRVLSWERVLELYRTHDVLCVPSRKEALGLANAEALAAGLPVVTTHAGGIPEVMDGEANGFLATPGDVADLAKKLRQCLEDPELSEMKTANGRAFILKRFDAAAMYRNLESILHEGIHHKLKGTSPQAGRA